MSASVPRPPVWMDGALVAWDEANVSILSHGIQRGALIFDVGVLRPGARGPVLFRPREHIERFLRSASLVGLSIPSSTEELLAATVATARASRVDTGLVRWSACIPTPEPDVVARSSSPARVAIAVIPPEDPQLMRSAALRVTIPSGARKAGPEVFPPQAKVAASYLGPMLAKRAAQTAGFDEVVLLDGEGRLAEAPTANVFVVSNGQLRTPPLDRVLAGITRDSVLAIARAEGILAVEEPLLPEDLRRAEEAFLTASSMPVRPIVSVDGQPLATAPGPITARIQAIVHACERGAERRFAHWCVELA